METVVCLCLKLAAMCLRPSCPLLDCILILFPSTSFCILTSNDLPVIEDLNEIREIDYTAPR